MAGKKLRGGGGGRVAELCSLEDREGTIEGGKKTNFLSYGAASCIHHVHAKYTILPVNTAETSLAEESKDGYISKL